MTKRRVAAFTILIIGIALLVEGIVTGDFNNVLHKAVVICYECIGIG